MPELDDVRVFNLRFPVGSEMSLGQVSEMLAHLADHLRQTEDLRMVHLPDEAPGIGVLVSTDADGEHGFLPFAFTVGPVQDFDHYAFQTAVDQAEEVLRQEAEEKEGL